MAGAAACFTIAQGFASPASLSLARRYIAAGEPERLLHELAGLRRRTRSARHAYWLPLVLSGLLICAAAQMYVQRQDPHGNGVYSSPGPQIQLAGLGGTGDGYIAALYWLFALVAGFWLTVTVVLFTGVALLASLYDVENVRFRLGWNPGLSQQGLTALPNVLLPAAILLVAVRITSQGRKALAAELATLTELVRRHSASPPD